MLRHASGLFVPADALPRRREVWPREDWKHVDRAAKLLNERQTRVTVVCGREGCPAPTLVAHSWPGSTVLRCGCTDRELTDKGLGRA